MKIGILVHGRHLQTRDWENVVWGQPPVKLGSLPMMVLVALNRGVENVSKVVFGTGASERDGLKESQYMLMYLRDMLSKLSGFDQIRNHPRFQSQGDLGLIDELIRNVECETTAQNTVEDIAFAAKIFSKAGVTEVIQVTNSSHAPRCIRDSAVAQEKGLIPLNQMWSVVRDLTTYSGTCAGDVVIIEPPHRGDDPMCQVPLHLLPHKVFASFFKIKGFPAKISALSKINQLIAKAAKTHKTT